MLYSCNIYNKPTKIQFEAHIFKTKAIYISFIVLEALIPYFLIKQIYPTFY